MVSDDARGTSDERTTETGAERDARQLARRGFMKLGAGAAFAAGLPAAVDRASASSGITLMADPSPEDSLVGGGKPYARKVHRVDGDYVVKSRKALLAGLKKASRGEIIYVPNDVKIDLTGESNLQMDDGVTLASGRGEGPNGSPGGLLYTDSYVTPLFKIYSDDIRVTGLRLRGPRLGYFDPSDPNTYAAEGMQLLGQNAEVDNCELFGWTLAAVSSGSKHRTYPSHVHHNSIHNNAMEGYGYGVNIYNGSPLVEWNYFNMNRHSITGFGYSTCGYEARYNLVGPKTVSHAFDMHGLNQNLSTDADVAGGTIHIHRNTFEFTHDVLGRAQEAVTIRGVPADGVRLAKNCFAHDTQPDDTNVGQNGQAYRQYNTGSDTWVNFGVAANHFGASRPCSDVGMPRPRDDLNAWAVDPDWQHGTRSGVGIHYPNGFNQALRITDVTIDPASAKIVKLADESWSEGRWKSEIHFEADLHDGTTDVNGGVDLPGSIDLDSDGHSSSPDTEPVLSGGSTAKAYLVHFLDKHGKRVDMVGERVTVTFDCVLADGTHCRDVFDVVPHSV